MLATEEELEERTLLQQDRMIESLEKFVAIPSVSADRQLREECRRAATFLKSLFKQMGADVKMVSCRWRDGGMGLRDVAWRGVTDVV